MRQPLLHRRNAPLMTIIIGLYCMLLASGHNVLSTANVATPSASASATADSGTGSIKSGYYTAKIIGVNGCLGKVGEIILDGYVETIALGVSPNSQTIWVKGLMLKKDQPNSYSTAYQPEKPSTLPNIGIGDFARLKVTGNDILTLETGRQFDTEKSRQEACANYVIQELTFSGTEKPVEDPAPLKPGKWDLKVTEIQNTECQKGFELNGFNIDASGFPMIFGYKLQKMSSTVYAITLSAAMNAIASGKDVAYSSITRITVKSSERFTGTITNPVCDKVSFTGTFVGQLPLSKAVAARPPLTSVVLLKPGIWRGTPSDNDQVIGTCKESSDSSNPFEEVVTISSDNNEIWLGRNIRFVRLDNGYYIGGDVVGFGASFPPFVESVVDVIEVKSAELMVHQVQYQDDNDPACFITDTTNLTWESAN